MDSEELLNRVRELRGQGRSPKAIARALGVSPSTVAPLVRAVAAEGGGTAPEPEVVGCWINAGWSTGLTVENTRAWQDASPGDENTAGMVSILAARRHRWDKLRVCGYLVDAYCLGVKDALGPEAMDEVELRNFRERYFSAYPSGWQDAPIELAQHMVFGAVDYARGLGFEPHPDFTQAADHLGTWEHASAITFGKDGQPFYASGPHDNPRAVIKTLERTVGKDNFTYVVGIG